MIRNIPTAVPAVATHVAAPELDLWMLLAFLAAVIYLASWSISFHCRFTLITRALCLILLGLYSGVLGAWPASLVLLPLAVRSIRDALQSPDASPSVRTAFGRGQLYASGLHQSRINEMFDPPVRHRPVDPNCQKPPFPRYDAPLN